MAKRILDEEERRLWQALAREVMPLRPLTGSAVELGIQADFDPEQLEVERKKVSAKNVVETKKQRNEHHQMAFSRGEYRTGGQRDARAHVMRAAAPRSSVGVRPAGLDNTQWKRLNQGRIPINARLDLHGHTVQDAFEAFCSFMSRAKSHHWRCVEIITGLGSGLRGGMIRQEFPYWLQRREIKSLILSVVYTHSGNHGAVRILLRKHQSRTGNA